MPALPKLRWPSGLRARVLVLLAIAVGPAMALLVAGGLQRRAERTAAIRTEALNLARLVAQAQQQRLEGARQFLIALSRASDVRGGDLAACTRYVRSLALEHKDTYNDIGLVDLSGRVVCHVIETAEPLIVADRAYFQRALATGNFTVGEHMIGRASGVPRLAFSYPLRDDHGTITGVLFASIDLMMLSRTLRSDRLAPDTTLAVLDRNGRIVARSVDPERSLGFKASAEQVRLMAARGELTAEFPGPDGPMRVYGVTTIRDAEGRPALFTTVGLRRDLAMAAIDRRLVLEIAALLVLAALSAVIAWYGAEALIRKPIARLLEATSVLASGRLNTRVRDMSGVREVMDLAAAFNAMARRLQHRDIHLRRAQRLEAVGQLAGGIAHDFNNLLTVIIGYGDTLRRRFDHGSSEATELDELLTAADRAADLTRQLLAFSRQQTLQPKPIHLNDIISHMHSMLTRVIGEDVRLVTVLGSDLGIVKADRPQLEQVLMNLVVNARDAMPAGGTLTIETLRSDVVAESLDPHGEPGSATPGPFAVMRVTDTGCGMDERTRTRIFEPFFSTKGSMGTGLGLATVYGIVKQSGGYITCDSEPGKGTRFSVYLPLTTEASTGLRERGDGAGGEDSTPLRPLGPGPGGQDSTGHEHVLVVEDEDGVRTLAAASLARHGYRVKATGRPSEALAWIEREEMQPDLLLVDMIMPEMNGVALYTAARRIRPAIRVLFMSGYAENSRDGARIPENAPYLAKPFKPADLLKKVRETLDASDLLA